MSTKQAYREVLQRIALALASGILALVICEVALAAARFPAAPSPRVAHPPNMEEGRKSPDFEYVFRTNSQGLREREIPLASTSGAIRVFVAGDSFTEGVGVADDQRFTGLLERTLSRAERPITFINGGLGGAGPLQYGRLFLNVGLEYAPDVLLICVYPNDVANTPEHIEPLDPTTGYAPRGTVKRVAYNLLPRLYTLASGIKSDIAFRKRTETTDFIATISSEARRRGIPREKIQAWQASMPSEYVDSINRGEMNGSPLSSGLLYPEYWTDSLDVTGPRAEQKYANMAALLTQLRRVAADHDVKVGLVYIPSAFQYRRRPNDHAGLWEIAGATIRSDWLQGTAELQVRLQDWASDNAVPFLDLTPVFRSAAARGEVTNWNVDGHWNAAGNELAAQAIARWIEASDILDEKPDKQEAGDR